jgi:hypothetical protein
VNRAQLRTRAYEVTGLTPTDPLATAGMMNRHIDAALRHVAADRDWPWLVGELDVPLVIEQGDYPAPANWIKTVDFTITEGPDRGPLTFVSMLSLDEMYPSTVQPGSPRHFAIANNVLRLRPVPNTVGMAVHRYKMGEPALVDDVAVPLMPAEYHDQLVELVAGLALGATRDQRGQDFWQRYTAWSKRLRDELNRKSGPQLMRVRPGGWL